MKNFLSDLRDAVKSLIAFWRDHPRVFWFVAGPAMLIATLTLIAVLHWHLDPTVIGNAGFLWLFIAFPIALCCVWPRLNKEKKGRR